MEQVITIKATDVALDLINKRDTGAPFGWVTSILQKVAARVPKTEQDSIVVYGLDKVYFNFTHTLTAEEAQKEFEKTISEKVQQLKSMLPREGLAMTSDEVAKIRKLLESI